MFRLIVNYIVPSTFENIRSTIWQYYYFLFPWECNCGGCNKKVDALSFEFRLATDFCREKYFKVREMWWLEEAKS